MNNQEKKKHSQKPHILEHLKLLFAEKKKPRKLIQALRLMVESYFMVHALIWSKGKASRHLMKAFFTTSKTCVSLPHRLLASLRVDCFLFRGSQNIPYYDF